MEDLPPTSTNEIQDGNVIDRKLTLTDSEKPLVEKVCYDLQKEFLAEKDNAVGSFFSGTPENALEAHKYFFSKTLSQENANDRRISNMAHLQLEIQYNKAIDRIESTREQRIGKSGLPLSQVFPYLYRYTGMVPSGTEIVKGTDGEKLAIEKENLVETFNLFTERYSQYYSLLEGNESQDGRSREELAAIAAAQSTVNEYFGMPNNSSSEINNQKYMEKNRRTLIEFQNDRSAVCTERSALAQELLSFAGIKTMLISGGPPLVADSNGNYEPQSKAGGHVFNILFLGEKQNRPFIFDPANYLLVPDKANPSILLIQPFVAPLSEKQFSNLLNDELAGVELGTEKRLYSLS